MSASEERRFYFPDVETASAEAWAAYQDDLARRAVTYAAENAPEAGERLRKAGLEAEEIRGVDGWGVLGKRAG